MSGMKDIKVSKEIIDLAEKIKKHNTNVKLIEELKIKNETLEKQTKTLEKDIKILKFKFFEDYTHVSPFTQNSLKQLLCDAGFRKYEVYNFPMRMFGIGFLYRNKILTAQKIHHVEKFVLNFPIALRLFRLFDNRANLIAECYK